MIILNCVPQHFLENLNPFDDQNDKDISNYLFDKSTEIEPKDCRIAPRFPRKYPNLNLKSPGIKSKSASNTGTGSGKSSNSGSSNSAASAITNAFNTMNSTVMKSDDSRSEDSSRSENDPVFAQVQLGGGSGTGGHNSPTTSSPVSPAAPTTSKPFMNWTNHSRSPSVSSVISGSMFRSSRGGGGSDTVSIASGIHNM